MRAGHRLRRYLDNETISARPPTTLYRLRKIVDATPESPCYRPSCLALAAGLSAVLFMNVRLTLGELREGSSQHPACRESADLEWQKAEGLADAGKRGDALPSERHASPHPRWRCGNADFFHAERR